MISIFSSSVPGSSSDALVAMVELASSAAANKTANAASCSLGIPLGEGEMETGTFSAKTKEK